ncbi:MAG: tetratricopeptide repeat protein [Ramlibacter sp.]|nr:tetratricopeptide repeat protein [Ramlibacter sp.]
MQEPAFNAQEAFAHAAGLHQQGDLAAAQALYLLVLAVVPQSATVWTHLGVACLQAGQFEDAQRHLLQSLTLEPGQLDPLQYRGMALAALDRHAQAADCFAAAVVLEPHRADLLNSLGVSLRATGRLTEALAAFVLAAERDPQCLEAHFNTANVLQILGRLEEALLSYDRALQLNRWYPSLMGYWLGIKMQLCDWQGLEVAWSELMQGIDAGAQVAAPFTVLATPCTAAQQRRCAELFANSYLPAAAPPLPTPSRTQRIRLGYFSGDFHEHATAYLCAGLFELHDRSRFEVIAFSSGPGSAKPMRQRLEAAFDRFIDIRGQSDAEVATLARSLGVDIAIDLKGYTADARPGIFCHRAAPLQVSYLGYPGTLGVDHVDYLVADATLIPQGDRIYYTEKIVSLPGSYQVNDARRAPVRSRFSRSELALPSNAFVFCCFNNSFKITPDVFGVWMRLLRACPASVLWLLDSGPTVVARLGAAARQQGIDPARLVFAPHLPQEEHMDRLGAADLFLDTFWLNAHTTASDALWAGVPVLTCPGGTLGSRVAASVLRALGLDELVAPSQDGYEALARSLATDPQRLAALRERLAVNRHTHPLFDTALFTRRMEQAYTWMWERRLRGEPADHFEVPD